MTSLFLAAAVKATFILTIAGGLRLLLRETSAAAKQLLWTQTFAALLLLPVLATTMPVMRPKIQAPSVAVTSALLDPAGIATPGPQPARPLPWRQMVFVIYLTGVAAVILKVAGGSARMWQVARRAAPFDGPVLAPVPVLVSSQFALPLTWGFFRPVILLPPAAQSWPMERLRVVIAHEMAHIRRWDFPGQVAAQLACALYWFHPLAWWAFQQLVREREQACDDEVLNMGINAVDYAEHLMSILRSAHARGGAFSPAVGMAQESSFELRLTRMLNPRLNRRAPGKRTAVVSAMLWACLLLPVAALRAPAQSATGSIAGVVRDPSGAVVPFVRVLATKAGGSNIEAADAGADGTFELAGIPSGRYTLEVRSPGFEAFRQPEVEVLTGGVTRFDVSMRLGGISESVEVLGKRTSGAAAAPQGVPQRIRVGGNVQASKLLSKVNPTYPETALQKGVQGTVMLRAVIGTDGRLLSLGAASAASDPDLTQAALDAVRLWTYEPTLLNGQAVEVVTTIAVTFRLQ